MVTSGTGHAGARLLARAHQAPEHHRPVASKKISKTAFGFKRGQKNFSAAL